MNAGKEELQWTQVSAVAGSAEYITAADAERLYAVLEFTDPAGLYGHEVGWRLVLHTISQDDRRILYGETRGICVRAAQEIHDGTFSGTLYGPTTIDQLDPSRSRRAVWDYDDGIVIEHYVLTSASPIGASQTVSLDIRDHETLRDILESIVDGHPDFTEATILLGKIEQIVTRHYAGKPRPERARYADLFTGDDADSEENAGEQ